MKVKCANCRETLCEIDDKKYDELKKRWYIEHLDTADGFELILLVKGHYCEVKQ